MRSMRTIFFIFLLSSKLTAAPEISRTNLEDFFDRKLAILMKKEHIAGAVVSAVSGRNIIFKKGYGFADIENKIPVDPDQTLFRPGSISKLFVWTAVMQLAEQHKLDLDRNINDYLDFKIPDTYKEPITMRHLMTHTPGFEDHLFGLFLQDPALLGSLRQVLTAKILKRVRPPGREISYSNYGAILAGYIIERISGMSFDDYIEKNIFSHLRMKNSSFRQPLPEKLQKAMSVGYLWDGKNFNKKGFELINGAPAGALSSTSTDIAKFLSAHLDKNGGNLLKPETIKTMHTSLFRPNPEINGIAYGFLEIGKPDLYVIGHGGDTVYFHSICIIIPEKNFGLFFSFNTGAGFTAAKIPTFELTTAFVDNFFPSSVSGKTLMQPFPEENYSRYAGDYFSNRRSESTFLKILGIGMNMKVEPAVDGIFLNNLLAGSKEKYVRIKKNLFQKEDGQSRIVFFEDSEGAIRGLFYGDVPIMTYWKPPFYESILFTSAVQLFSLFFLVTGFFLKPTGIFAIFRKNQIRNSLQWYASLNAFFVTVIYLFFFLSVSAVIDDDFIFKGAPPVWPFLIPWAAFLLSFGLIFFSVAAWKKNLFSVFGKIYYNLFTLGIILFFWFLWYWEIAY